MLALSLKRCFRFRLGKVIRCVRLNVCFLKQSATAHPAAMDPKELLAIDCNRNRSASPIIANYIVNLTCLLFAASSKRGLVTSEMGEIM